MILNFLTASFLDSYITFEYGLLFILVISSIILAFIVFFISFLPIFKIFEMEKLMAYECGFSPFSDARDVFDVRFYLVAILFIVFDLELVFLLPWVLVVKPFYFVGFGIVLLFLIILIVGFVYEWFKGALDWHVV